MTWLLSRLLTLMAGVAGLVGLLLGYRWQKHKRHEAEARADGLEATLEHREQIGAINAETARVEGELDESLKGAGLRDYFRDGRLLRRDTEGGPS